MSLVVGIKCDDGSLVIASDTAMSLRAGDGADYVSLSTNKIFCEKDYIFAVAGAVWINQKVRKLSYEIFSKDADFSEEGFKSFLDGIGRIIKEDVELRLNAGLESGEEIKNSVVLNTLVAYKDMDTDENRMWIADNSLKGRYVEEKFVVFSDKDLAYMPLKEFEDYEIWMDEGKLLAFKAIRDTIRLSPVFVAEPIDIATMDKEGNVSKLEGNEIEKIGKAYLKMREESYNALLRVSNPTKTNLREEGVNGALKKDKFRA